MITSGLLQDYFQLYSIQSSLNSTQLNFNSNSELGTTQLKLVIPFNQVRLSWLCIICWTTWSYLPVAELTRSALNNFAFHLSIARVLLIMQNSHHILSELAIFLPSIKLLIIIFLEGIIDPLVVLDLSHTHSDLECLFPGHLLPENLVIERETIFWLSQPTKTN